MMISIINRFLNPQGQLTQYPAKRKMQLRVLYYLAEKMEKDRIYTEKEINELLLAWHTFGDPATLRRDLFNHGLLERTTDGGSYWRKEILPTPTELEERFLY